MIENGKRKSYCKNCTGVFPPDELTSGYLNNSLNGLCSVCFELDDTPTSLICDNDDNPSFVSIGSANYCEDCYDQMLEALDR